MAKPKISKDLKGVKFTTPLARLSFPKLFKPEQFQGKGDAYFGCALLFPKSSDLGEMKKAIVKAATEAFGEKANWPKDLSLPWRDGDDQADYEGYADHYYVNAKTKRKPVIVGRDKAPIEDESEIYGGLYGRAVLVAKATESGGKYYVSLYLQGFQKWKDGPQFGGGVNVNDDFADDLDDDMDDDTASDDSDEMGF